MMEFLTIRFRNGWKDKTFIYWIQFSIVTGSPKGTPAFRIFITLFGLEFKLLFGNIDKLNKQIEPTVQPFREHGATLI